jgi:hypothetical protein
MNTIELRLPASTFGDDNRLTFACDGLVTSHVWGGIEEKFQLALKTARSCVKHSLYHEYRLYISTNLILQSLVRASREFECFNYVECGVGEGHTLLVSSLFIQQSPWEKDFLTGNFTLFDTFNGIDLSLTTPEERQRPLETTAYYDSDIASIVNKFNYLRNLFVIKGSIPPSLTRYPETGRRHIHFLHLDMNNAIPEACALEFFLPKMKFGSIILFDDYGAQWAAKQRELIDKVCYAHLKLCPTTLPTGQAVLLV